MNEKGQTALEMIMTMGVVITLVTLLFPFTIQFYYGIHSDTLVKEIVLNYLAEQSLEDDTHYYLASLTATEVGDREMAYNITVRPTNILEVSKEINDEMENIVLRQTNLKDVTLTFIT